MNDHDKLLALLRRAEALADSTAAPGERQAALNWAEQLKAELPPAQPHQETSCAHPHQTPSAHSKPERERTARGHDPAAQAEGMRAPEATHRRITTITASDEWNGRLLVGLARALGLICNIDQDERTVVLEADDPVLEVFVQLLDALSRELAEWLGQTTRASCAART
jgi:hypothetical protein